MEHDWYKVGVLRVNGGTYREKLTPMAVAGIKQPLLVVGRRRTNSSTGYTMSFDVVEGYTDWVRMAPWMALPGPHHIYERPCVAGYSEPPGSTMMVVCESPTRFKNGHDLLLMHGDYNDYAVVIQSDESDNVLVSGNTPK